MTLFTLFACARIVPAGTDSELALAPPTITEASLSCSAADDLWTFEVTTTSWTGNGTVLLALDLDYVEEHEIRSEESGADGSWDHLELELSVEADPRDATPGSSTAFLCDVSTKEGISGRIAVEAPEGGGEADCRQWGELDFASLGFAACSSL